MKVLVSGSLNSPAAAGLFRPFVLVPESCSAWTLQDWQIVMEHELEHVNRRHSLTKLLARICCVIYWFHPMVWWAARRHSLESERICDERVVSHGIDPATYAETLIRFAVDRQQGFERRIEFMTQVSTLQSRISAMLGDSPSKLSVPVKMTMALLLCFVASATVLVDSGWSNDRKPAKHGMFGALPEPNSIEDPYREPESELVRENADAQVVDASLNDPRDRSLFGLLQPLTHHVPRSRADYVAKRARWALAQTEGGELIRPLLKRLEDQDWRIRAYAAYVLGLGRIREAVPALIRCMDHPVWRMRAMAAFALTEIGDPIAAKALQKSLSDPAWQVRVAAVPFFAADSRWRSVIEQIRSDENGLVRDADIETIRRMEN